MPSAAWVRKIAREVATELRKADRGTKGLRTHRKARTQKIPASIEIKPRARPKYDAASKGAAVLGAAQMSAKYNRSIFVYPYYGRSWALTYKESGLSAVDIYYEVNGRDVYTWQRK